jgi:hypothetical protein
MTQQLVTESNGAAPADRVRSHTAEELNRAVDRETRQCIEALASSGREEVTRHIRELEREWDVERYLQTNASILALAGIVLGAAVSRKFLLLPGVVFSFFLQHAVQGWCPPVPVFRRLGVRTRKEINRERFALKALRGDFNEIAPGGRLRPGERWEELERR